MTEAIGVALGDVRDGHGDVLAVAVDGDLGSDLVQPLHGLAVLEHRVIDVRCAHEDVVEETRHGSARSEFREARQGVLEDVVAHGVAQEVDLLVTQHHTAALTRPRPQAEEIVAHLEKATADRGTGCRGLRSVRLVLLLHFTKIVIIFKFPPMLLA